MRATLIPSAIASFAVFLVSNIFRAWERKRPRRKGARPRRDVAERETMEKPNPRWKGSSYRSWHIQEISRTTYKKRERERQFRSTSLGCESGLDASHNMLHIIVITVCNPYGEFAGSLGWSLPLMGALMMLCKTLDLTTVPLHCRHLASWVQEILFCTTSVKGKKAWPSRFLLNWGPLKCRISLIDESFSVDALGPISSHFLDIIFKQTPGHRAWSRRAKGCCS